MAGNINNSLLLLFLFLLCNCYNLKKTDEKENIYIRLNKNISYNQDIVSYYIVNKTDNDIRILCNPDFFQREKDSLFINTWFNPKINIYNNKNIVIPGLFRVNYKGKILDSLASIKEEYKEIESLSNINNIDLSLLRRYIKTIKRNDSMKFSTRIDFENEPRFYDFSEIEGYILKKDKKYNLKICLNENINPQVRDYLKKENIYNRKICSNQVQLVFIKTNYSDE
ncbi:hypothetical protein LF887_01455 [Chryseobacterium sp. MEBOG06]|uniref:hypothetical protein n=1 Tax=Chryseobacterium sp. MEBOG06 TaxID=2879938 RepID=UPI001F3300B2|nr:hypothetical protein [Chryseobacterium sp. MEBOG06]UKB84348.1 hypothetical protein LF887_01455 [Chryseobacterium sp. MEBOG06]